MKDIARKRAKLNWFELKIELNLIEIELKIQYVCTLLL